MDVPYKYTDQELDSSTDLYYYSARYYDPALGRFLSPDTIVPNPRQPQDLNRYSYARNNPFGYTDPTGHEGEPADGGWGWGGWWGWFMGLFGPPIAPPPTLMSPTLLPMGDLGAQMQLNSLQAQRPGIDSASLLRERTQPSFGAILGDFVSSLLAPGWIYSAITGELPFSGEKLSGLERALPFLALGTEIGALSKAADTIDAIVTSTRAGSGGIGPVLKGIEGVERAIAEIEANGGAILGRNLTLEANGMRTIPDLYVRYGDGTLAFVEVKNGPGARLTVNQEALFPVIREFGATPYGQRAFDAGLTVGKPIGPTRVDVLHYNK